MNSRVLRQDQSLFILLTLNKHPLRFRFTHAELHLIKLKIYNNSSAQAVNSVLCEIQRNQSNLLTFEN